MGPKNLTLSPEKRSCVPPITPIFPCFPLFPPIPPKKFPLCPSHPMFPVYDTDLSVPTQIKDLFMVP